MDIPELPHFLGILFIVCMARILFGPIIDHLDYWWHYERGNRG